jgi:hypothetical protein
MSWNSCKKCVFVPRSSFTSALFKVLLTLKLLHGSRTGAKGSTLEDIAMHMIKHFCLDGDIKSQVLASLKYGVKMHFIQKKKEKFSLILPASSIHLAPCKFKNEETERIQCIFPPTWYSNVCNDVCAHSDQSCCGKRKRQFNNVCCQDENEEESEDTCDPCQSQRSKSVCKQPVCSQKGGSQSTCSKCYAPATKKSRRGGAAPCPKPRPPVCSRKRRKGPPKSVYDDYCQLCPQTDVEDDDEDQCDIGYKYDAHKNCSCCQ